MSDQRIGEAPSCNGANCRNRKLKNAAEEAHTCPYAEEINDDHETLCTCCRECARECADDI